MLRPSTAGNTPVRYFSIFFSCDGISLDNPWVEVSQSMLPGLIPVSICVPNVSHYFVLNLSFLTLQVPLKLLV